MVLSRASGKGFVGHGFSHDIASGAPVPSDAQIPPQQVFTVRQVRDNG
jgi:hypothetical protein